HTSTPCQVIERSPAPYGPGGPPPPVRLLRPLDARRVLLVLVVVLVLVLVLGMITTSPAFRGAMPAPPLLMIAVLPLLVRPVVTGTVTVVPPCRTITLFVAPDVWIARLGTSSAPFV